MTRAICDQCCACGNCVHICPQQAVHLQYDSYGNCQAIIDLDRCVECNLCSANCPMNDTSLTRIPTEAYAAISYAPETVHSTSGGIFFELARTVIKQGGIVSGAAYDDNWNVRHILVDSQSSLIKLQGSKYVKSDSLRNESRQLSRTQSRKGEHNVLLTANGVIITETLLDCKGTIQPYCIYYKSVQ